MRPPPGQRAAGPAPFAPTERSGARLRAATHEAGSPPSDALISRPVDQDLASI